MENANSPTLVHFTENCFVRSAPGREGAVLGVMKRGQTLPGGGAASPNGWRAVIYRGQAGWVSGKFTQPIS